MVTYSHFVLLTLGVLIANHHTNLDLIPFRAQVIAAANKSVLAMFRCEQVARAAGLLPHSLLLSSGEPTSTVNCYREPTDQGTAWC